MEASKSMKVQVMYNLSQLYWFFGSLLLFVTLSSAHGQETTKPHVIVLGVAQDGGYPHIGCEKKCCMRAHHSKDSSRFVVSLALVDPKEQKWWLFEATPDMADQLRLFREITKGIYPYLPEGIFVTHAHIGHYTGLMELGREALGSNKVHVHALPGMCKFLQSNGPWSQLVELNNIVLMECETNAPVTLSESVMVTPFAVPHRDEFSETAGFRIETKGRNYLFIPDIDKWEKWEKNIVKEVDFVDVAFLDATFWSITELPFRNIKMIPHPLVSETIEHFKDSDSDLKRKVTFIHFNHTNKMMWDKGARQEIEESGFSIAIQGATY